MPRPVVVLGTVEEIIRRAVLRTDPHRFEVLESPVTGEALVDLAIGAAAVAIVVSPDELRRICTQLPSGVSAVGLSSGAMEALLWRDGQLTSIPNPQPDQVVAFIRNE